MYLCTSVQKHRGWLQPQSLAKRVYEDEWKEKTFKSQVTTSVP